MMSEANGPSPYHPDDLRAFVESCAPEPRRDNRWRWVAFFGVAMAVVLLTGPTALGVVVPWLAIGGLVYWVMRERRKVVDAQQGLRKLNDLTALRYHDEAIDHAWRLLPTLRPWPELHLQTVLLASLNLIARHMHDSAVALQDYLLAHMPPGHPTALMLRCQRLTALLHDDRLTDADDELRRLDRADLPPVGRAMHRLGRLYQQVKTGHFDDAAADLSEDLVQQLQPLGVEAGYGYALAAYVQDQRGEPDAADHWWQRATLLTPIASLREDLPELDRMGERRPTPSLAQAMEADRS